jgi:hypothetical protein
MVSLPDAGICDHRLRHYLSLRSIELRQPWLAGNGMGRSRKRLNKASLSRFHVFGFLGFRISRDCHVDLSR